MKFIYTDRRLEVSNEILPDLLDFLLEPDYITTIDGRRLKTMGTREKIKKYEGWIFNDK